MELDEICDVFFNGLTKPKHLRFFDEVTPKGNKITGYINQKPNRYLGSMIILTVNGEEVHQFIQSMPKIHYYTDNRDILKDYNCRCYEKLDGSCLILYPLKNKENKIIEIIPKTRGRPIADNHFIGLYDKIDKKPIQKYYQQHKGVLIFELYGILNQHDIIHYDTGIDIALIGIYEDNKFTNDKNLVERYGFRLSDQVFELYNEGNDYYIKNTSRKYSSYLPTGEEEYYPTVTDAVNGLKHKLEELNKEYYSVNGRLALEGVVINTIRENGTLKWLKCKPRDIESKHKTVNGINRRSITKEVLKYFDEYGSDVKEIYQQDPNHHTEYIHRMLNEEYGEDLIFKSRKKIERIFMEIWESKSVPQSIHNICYEIVDEYGEEGLSHCMRIFAEKYPQKKKDARLVYGVMEKLFIKKGLEL